MIRLLSVLLILCLVGCCSTEHTWAPVVNAWQDPCAMKSRYRVQKDDTLYSIAWAFDLDYRDLARANHLTKPYHLKPGQTLTMCTSAPEEEPIATATFAMEKRTPFVEIPCQQASFPDIPEPCIQSRYAANEELDLPQIQNNPSCRNVPACPICDPNLPLPLEMTHSNQIIPARSGCWSWPACGKVVRGFALQPGGNKGIDIAGQLGDPIRAIAPGKVVYSGNGLKGYGNLIIIKHSDNYLSAYAYNRKLLVKEGDIVKAGTEIANMGQNDSGRVLLHFEIRQNGKPVNPLLYL